MKFLLIILMCMQFFACASAQKLTQLSSEHATNYQNEIQRMVIQLGQSLEQNEERLALALSATNWRLRHEPRCLDLLFEQYAELDLRHKKITQAHRQSYASLLDLQNEQPMLEQYQRMHTAIEQLHHETAQVEQSLAAYLQKTMNPSQSCQPQEQAI